MNSLRKILDRDVLAGGGTLLKGRSAYAVHAVALILVALLGWFDGRSPPAAVTVPGAGPDTLTVPTWSPAQLGERRAQALGMVAFEPDPSELEALAATAKEPEPAPEDPAARTGWRFIGTARQGETVVAFVIAADAKRILTLGASDSLPNGERIEAIGPDRLVFTDGADRRELKLFDPKKPETKDAP
ncbi:MAG: hypothetical protein SFV21_22050 [Rhodospirillaceae bacterium]|nr:hypothetical protein [Rhodospirillaceae bacterium]